MNLPLQPANGLRSHLGVVHMEPSGQYTVQVVGLPEIRATAATEKDAIDQVRRLLTEWLATARLVRIELPTLTPGCPPAESPGQLSRDDPLEQIYLEEMERLRQEDLEQTLREFDQQCSDSSSTPTT